MPAPGVLQHRPLILPANGDVDAVYVHDDDMTQGVVQAIRNAGRDDER